MCRTLLLISATCFARPALAAEPSCALAISVEGIEGAALLQDKLTIVARREGACGARSWALRVSPAPKGAYIVALWNGSVLETRFAGEKAEVEPVASLLLRVAVARDAEVPAPAVSPRATDASAVATGGPGTEPPVTALASSTAVIVALEGGPVVSAGGVGGRAGLLALGLGRTFGAGAFADYGAQAGPRRSRGEAEAGGIAVVGTSVGQRVWLGAALELGVSVQRARGDVDGTERTATGTGVLLGAGGLLLISPTARLRLGSRLGARWSSATAAARTLTTVTDKTPGNGNPRGEGQGVDKTRTETSLDPASREASEAVGGAALALTLVAGIAF